MYSCQEVLSAPLFLRYSSRFEFLFPLPPTLFLDQCRLNVSCSRCYMDCKTKSEPTRECFCFLLECWSVSIVRTALNPFHIFGEIQWPPKSRQFSDSGWQTYSRKKIIARYKGIRRVIFSKGGRMYSGNNAYVHPRECLGRIQGKVGQIGL